MKLKVLDQIAVSSLQADSLRPGQEVTVSKAVADDLLKAHPSKFEIVGDEEPEPAPAREPVSAKKAEPAPKNKAEKDPPNKAAKTKA